MPTTRALAANSPVELGIVYTKDLSAGQQAVAGGSTAQSSDPTAPFKAVIDYLNAHGGLFGHQIKPVYFGESLFASDAAAQDQSACTALTQDVHPVAVVISAAHTSTLWSCFEQAGLPYFDWSYDVDNGVLATYPHLAFIDGISLTRLAKDMVDGLYQQGYFSPGAKIGLVSANLPAYARAVHESLIPALKAHGLSLTDEVDVDNAGTVSGAGQQSAEEQSDVLKFRSEGIDHVVFLDWSVAIFFWAQQANAQHYTPRLGIMSNDLPGVADNGAGYPAAQFTNALALGWTPYYDLASPTVNAAAKQCNAIQAAEGQPGPPNWQTCDLLLTLTSATSAAGSFGASAIISGLGRIQSPQSAFLLGPPSFVSGRHDDVGSGAMMAYKSSCTCFQYVTQPYPLS